MNGDLAANLSATGLVTNTYLYTGDEKYKKWVLEYVDAWMDRMRQNNGILLDNVGPTGKVGEHRDGVWYGGLYGWNGYYGYTRLFHSVMVATECAVLLSGDLGYTELMRSQIKMLLEQSFTREDGHLLVPVRVEPDGWVGDKEDPVFLGPRLLRVYEPVHVYHMTMSQEDYDIIVRLRDGNKERDHLSRRPSGRLRNPVQSFSILRRQESQLARKGAQGPVPAGARGLRTAAGRRAGSGPAHR